MIDAVYHCETGKRMLRELVRECRRRSACSPRVLPPTVFLDEVLDRLVTLVSHVLEPYSVPPLRPPNDSSERIDDCSGKR